jgi:crotonobetainyl-CoA:carnitine CoA-transferase CaiB-like acyl-CoA transferase
MRIIEIGGFAAGYAGRLFADRGEDVIKLEPPGGDAIRSVAPQIETVSGVRVNSSFAFFHINKSFATLDLNSADGESRLIHLAKTADLLLVEEPYAQHLITSGVRERLVAQAPTLVVVFCTGFGAEGPYAGYRADDLAALAMAGILRCAGSDEAPPTRLPGHSADVFVGLAMASAGSMALLQRDDTGRGRVVDVSKQEALASTTTIVGVAKYLQEGFTGIRGRSNAGIPSGYYPTKNGLVRITAYIKWMWRVLAQWVYEVTGEVKILDEMFEGGDADRYPYADLLDHWLTDFAVQFTTEEILLEAERRKLTIAAVNDLDGVLSHPQLAARGYFHNPSWLGNGAVYPGPAYRTSDLKMELRSPSESPGRDDHTVFAELTARDTALERNDGAETEGILSGVRVLDLSGQMGMPWMARHLAHHGAEVLTVESSLHPSKIRGYIPPYAPHLGVRAQDNPSLTEWHAGKLSLGMDLNKPESQDLLDRLFSISDVVVFNRLPKTAKALKIDFARVAAANPAAIMVHNTGYGLEGPYANNGAFGDHIESAAGISHLLRDPTSGAPGSSGTLLIDYIAGLHGLYAVLEALRSRRVTGRGQFIDLSMLELAVSSIGDVIGTYALTGEEPEPGNRIENAAPYGVYVCDSGERHCTISIYADDEWARFCRFADREEWLEDPRFATHDDRLRHRAELDAAISEWTRHRSAFQTMYGLQRLGVHAGVVQDAPGLLQDPQLQYRGFFRTYLHPTGGGVIGTGVAVSLQEPEGRALRTGFLVGQDTEYLVGDLLGLGPRGVANLVDAAAIEIAEPWAWPGGEMQHVRAHRG